MVGIPADAAVMMRVQEIEEEFSHHGARKPARFVAASSALLRSDQLGLERSCPVCGEAVSKVFEFFAKYQYRLGTSAETQAAHAASGGFCPMHTWEFERIASPRGICASYAVLLNDVAHRLRDLAATASSAGELSRGLSRLATTRPHCTACEVQASAEEAALAKLVSKMAENEGYKVQELPLLCFLHLPPFLARIEDAELGRRLLEQQAEMCERVSENMQRYVLKFDSVRRALLSDEERNAHQQGLRIVAGHRKVAAAGVESDDLWRG